MLALRFLSSYETTLMSPFLTVPSTSKWNEYHCSGEFGTFQYLFQFFLFNCLLLFECSLFSKLSAQKKKIEGATSDRNWNAGKINHKTIPSSNEVINLVYYTTNIYFFSIVFLVHAYNSMININHIYGRFQNKI